jgi:hypothetical protein
MTANMVEGFDASKGKDLPACLKIEKFSPHRRCSPSNLNYVHSTSQSHEIQSAPYSPDSTSSDKLFDFETALDSACGDLPFLVRTSLCDPIN